MELIINQIKWLSYKNFLLDIRSWKINIIRFVLPLITALAILIFVTSSLVQPKTKSGNTITVGNLPQCDQYEEPDGGCTSLVYYISDPLKVEVQTVNEIMQRICDFNPTPLTFGTDVKELTEYDIIRAGGTMLDFFYINLNSTYGGIEWTYVNSETGNYSYTVYYNMTDVEVFTIVGTSNELFENNQLSNIEGAVERAILSVLFNKTSPDFMNVQVAEFPYVSNIEAYSSIKVSWDLSLVIIYCGVTFSALVVLVNLVSEKEEGCRGQMKFSGLLDFSFWMCEIANQFFFSVVSVIIMVSISWLIPGLTLFHQCNYFVLLFVMFSYQVNANGFSTLLSTFISQRKTANIMACILFAVGLTATLIFSLLDADIYSFFGGTLGNIFWSLLPWFSFTRSLMDIKLVTVGPTYQSSTFYCRDWMGTGGDYFQFENMFHLYVDLNEDDCQYYDIGWIPTMFGSILFLILQGIMFYLLAFICDKIVPSDKHRAAQSILSLFSFGGGEMKMGEEALVIEHLSKTYRKNIFSAAGTLALKPFLLKTPNSSVLCLLGPNGAGKTTTISCLTGLTKPSEGDAYLYGLSINSHMDEIRKNMGVCPQFDLLWPDLTAWEHMRILNGFKPKGKRMSEKELLERLGDVRLADVKDKKSKSYSGGMKRRLSMVISTIGDPLILFLDEPTTGMDPDNRQYVWKLIKRLKHNRLVILTTHSMEEADHLGDVVGIMAKGKLRCYGRPLELKARFGLGFRVTLTTSLDQVDNLKEYVGQILPGAQLRGENAGALVYNLPDVDPDESIIHFFEKLEKSLIPGITDWGIQNTTLEDVYLSISRKVMGQDISFEGAQMFDRDERQMFKDSVERYEQKVRSVQFEIDSLRKLLEQNGIDHSVVPPTKSKKKFVFTEDLAEGRL